MQVLVQAERMIRTEEKSKILESITDKFGGQTLQEAFSSLSGLNREICLMNLGLLCPKMAGELNELAGIPLEKFSNPKSVSHYLEALVNSGVAAEEERGVIYVMGNTSVGKTSLVNTFKNYIENPTEEPVPILTKKDDTLIETKVLEI